MFSVSSPLALQNNTHLLSQTNPIFSAGFPIYFSARAGVQASNHVQQGAPAQLPASPADVRRHQAALGWTVRRGEALLPSVCLVPLTAAPKARSSSPNQTDSCAHMVPEHTRTRTRICCLNVLFWEGLLSRCRTPKSIDQIVLVLFFFRLGIGAKPAFSEVYRKAAPAGAGQQ